MKAIVDAQVNDPLKSVLVPHWNTVGVEIVDLSLEDGKFRLTFEVDGKKVVIKNMAGLKAFVQNLASWATVPTLQIIDHPPP